jgi:pimeloyl-ACP methyl ester carboxylesterase
MHGWITDVAAVANAEGNGPDELLWLSFAPSESHPEGQGIPATVRRAAGGPRQAQRPGGRSGLVRRDRRRGIPDPSKLNRPAGITQAALVANGDNDTMIPTVNTHILARHPPNARVRIYAGAGHGFRFQLPTEFAKIVANFLA